MNIAPPSGSVQQPIVFLDPRDERIHWVVIAIVQNGQRVILEPCSSDLDQQKCFALPIRVAVDWDATTEALLQHPVVAPKIYTAPREWMIERRAYDARFNGQVIATQRRWAADRRNKSNRTAQ